MTAGDPPGSLGTYLDDIDFSRTGDRAECSAVIASDFKGFGGHFPGNPLLAGAFQLEILKILAGTIVPAGCVPSKVEHARFRKMLGPGDRVRAEVRWDDAGGRSAVKALLLVGKDRACQATFLYSSG